jgi:hypothetical protein
VSCKCEVVANTRHCTEGVGSGSQMGLLSHELKTVLLASEGIGLSVASTQDLNAVALVDLGYL